MYIGEFVDGMRHGKGVFRFANGDRYEGEFDKNLFDGYGVFVWNTAVDEYNNMIIGKSISINYLLD